MIKVENGQKRYFDRNGKEITEGCEIKYLHGDKSLERIAKVYRTDEGSWVQMPQTPNGLRKAGQYLVSMVFTR